MTRPTLGATALACFSLLLLGGQAFAKSPQAHQPGRHVLEGSEVTIHNLAGEMRIVEGTGNSVVVEIQTGGTDGDRLTVERRTDTKGRPVLWVVYPENRIVYDKYGFGPPSRHSNSRSSLDYNGHRVTVTSRGTGLDAHADIRILVPRGKTVHAHCAVGPAYITNVEGEISFEGASSTVQAERVSGSLAVDLGSGDVAISRSSALISADTGSGNIMLTEVDGNIAADAGSGDIRMKRIGSEKISIDAGSGSITGSDIRATTISADCGSGEIDLDGTTVGTMALSAGSGSVHLRLTKNIERLAIEAGSGSVKLEAPGNLSARFRIECPRRNLHIDFPTDIERGDDDLTEGTIGSGHGTIHIEAGSGSVDLVKM